ncbi:MAG: VOC family protein [Actinomycetes bacterium]
MDSASHVIGLRMICVDAGDPASLAGFWAALLGGEMSVDDDGDARVELSGSQRLDFLKVPESKTLKNRLHLDLAVADVAAATAEALALGASLADDVYDGGRWQVLRDPEGNEFCLLPPELS